MSTEYGFSDRDVFKHLLRNGIPRPLIGKDNTLKHYGHTGNFLAQLLTDPDAWRTYFKDKPVLNLYSSSLVSWDVLALMIRGFLTMPQEAQYTTLYDIKRKGGELLDELSDKRVIGIGGFYSEGHATSLLKDEERIQLEYFITRHLQSGGLLLVSSTSVSSEFGNWYSDRVVTLFANNGRDVQVDSGN